MKQTLNFDTDSTTNILDSNYQNYVYGLRYDKSDEFWRLVPYVPLRKSVEYVATEGGTIVPSLLTDVIWINPISALSTLALNLSNYNGSAYGRSICIVFGNSTNSSGTLISNFTWDSTYIYNSASLPTDVFNGSVYLLVMNNTHNKFIITGKS